MSPRRTKPTRVPIKLREPEDVAETPIEQLHVIFSGDIPGERDDGMKLAPWMIEAADAAFRDGSAPVPGENRYAVRVLPPEEAGIIVLTSGERRLYISTSSPRISDERWRGVARLFHCPLNGSRYLKAAPLIDTQPEGWIVGALEDAHGRGQAWQSDIEAARLRRTLERVVPVKIERRVKFDNAGASFSEVIWFNHRWLSFRRVSLVPARRAEAERMTNYNPHIKPL